MEECAYVCGDVAQLVTELVRLANHGEAQAAHHVTHKLRDTGRVLRSRDTGTRSVPSISSSSHDTRLQEIGEQKR